MSITRQSNQLGSFPPIYSYEPVPDAPSVTTLRIETGAMRELDPDHAHAHTFLAVIYFDHGAGAIRLGDREWAVQSGDLYAIAPGEVIGAGADVLGLAEASAWVAYFPPEFITRSGTEPQPSSPLAWRTNPLLLPFVREARSHAQPLRVSEAERPTWLRQFELLDDELRQRRFGFERAALAHLTLMLVDIARLAGVGVSDLHLPDDPMLARVFEVIESRFHEPITLRDVAQAVSLTPNYLTTILRRRTGQTVQGWIVERRMTEARRLLIETDLAIEEISRRVGYRDPSYFVKLFRRGHTMTPLAWRHGSRTAARDNDITTA